MTEDLDGAGGLEVKFLHAVAGVAEVSPWPLNVVGGLALITAGGALTFAVPSDWVGPFSLVVLVPGVLVATGGIGVFGFGVASVFAGGLLWLFGWEDLPAPLGVVALFVGAIASIAAVFGLLWLSSLLSGVF